MAGGLRPIIFGKRIIVNLNTKRGYRVSPGVNSRSRAIAKCARGQDLATRKKCFETGGK